MYIMSVLLFALSANMDNFVVGTSYGIRKIRIGTLPNLAIGIITSAGTLLSMLAGRGMAGFIPIGTANIIGSLMLLLIGCTYLSKYLKQIGGLRKKTPPPTGKLEKYDKDHSGKIELRESLALGLALSVNNIGLGIGAGITGLSIVITPTMCLVFSIASIYLGNMLGTGCISKFFGRYAEPAASLLIIFLALYEILCK